MFERHEALAAGAHFFCTRCAIVQDYVQLRAELRAKRHDELHGLGAQLAEGRGGLHNGAVAALGTPAPDPFYVKPAYSQAAPPAGVSAAAAGGAATTVAPSKQDGMKK